MKKDLSKYDNPSDELRKACLDACRVRDACNLSGVVFDFARIMQVICDEAKKSERLHDTTWKNNHPVVVAFVNKLMSMCNAEEFNTYSSAFDYCEQNKLEK